MNTSYTLRFVKTTDENDTVTYTHDDNGMRFVVNRLNSDGYDIINVDSPDGMNFVMNLLSTAGYENPAVTI